jgi:hypothetical protein
VSLPADALLLSLPSSSLLPLLLSSGDRSA